MSASGTRPTNKLEEDVAAILGMRENVFRRQPNSFLVTHAFSRGEKPRIVSAAAAYSGVIILAALFVGFLSLSRLPSPDNHLKIDLASDFLVEPHAKAFAVVIPAERSGVTRRIENGMFALPSARHESGNGVPKVLKTAPAREERHRVPRSGRSQAKIHGSRHEMSQTASAESNVGSEAREIDNEHFGSQREETEPNRFATSSPRADPQALNIATKALDNRRSGIDALRALRHQ